jgi:hypothetical protein
VLPWAMRSLSTRKRKSRRIDSIHPMGNLRHPAVTSALAMQESPQRSVQMLLA